MFLKKKMMVLLVLAMVLTAFVGCTSTDAKSTIQIANYKQGSLNQTELTDQLIQMAGLQSMLDFVDTGILNDIEPVTEDMSLSVEERIASIKVQYPENFEVTLQMNGFANEDELRKAFLLDSQRQAYITKYVASNVITAEEIQAYYDAFEPEIQASHILIQAADNSDVALAAAKQEAEDLIARINAGEDFAALAVEFSKDPGSGAQGGDLGSFGRGAMVEAFEDAAFALEVGQVTQEPVQTQFGFHIIKKTSEGQKLSMEDMKPEIETILTEEKLQADQNLASFALIKLREENGLEIINPVLAEQYRLFTEQVSQ